MGVCKNGRTRVLGFGDGTSGSTTVCERDRGLGLELDLALGILFLFWSCGSEEIITVPAALHSEDCDLLKVSRLRRVGAGPRLQRWTVAGEKRASAPHEGGGWD
jgi:hypothetical protein